MFKALNYLLDSISVVHNKSKKFKKASSKVARRTVFVPNRLRWISSVGLRWLMIWGSWVSIGDEFISKPIILFRILSIIYLGLNKIEFKKKYCIEPTTPNILSDFTRITRMFFYSNCLVQLKIVEDGLVSVGCENHGCWKLEPTVHLGNVIVVLPNSGDRINLYLCLGLYDAPFHYIKKKNV